MFFYKIIATFFGIGYIGKGAGTIAAMVFCVLLYLCVELKIYSNNLLLIFSAIVFIAGIIVAGKVEPGWGKDSKRVVIDEVLGMAISLLFLPINFITILIGLILFRFFDIAKPLYIRKFEKLKAGWGVMMDDLVAGIYANILLQLITLFIFNYEDIF